MNILHISDIHFRKNYEQSNDGYKGMLLEMSNPLTLLEKCLQEVMDKTPIDLMIISGDLTEDGTVEDYRFLKNYIKSLVGNIKIIVTLGNHDIKENFRVGWLNEVPSNMSYNVIEEFDDFYVLSFDNSVHKNHKGHVSESQFAWLESAFERIGDKPILFVTHHHLLNNQNTIPCLPESDKLLQLLRKQHIICIMTGHTHHQYTGKVAGTRYNTVAGMSFCGEDVGNGIVRFVESYGYNLYRMDGGKIKRKTSEVFFPEKLLKVVNMAKADY